VDRSAITFLWIKIDLFNMYKNEPSANVLMFFRSLSNIDVQINYLHIQLVQKFQHMNIICSKIVLETKT